MKVLFLILLLNSAYAWELRHANKKVHLMDQARKINEPVIATMDEQLQVKKINADLTLLTYLEGEGGTKETSKVYNCAVYSDLKKKFLMKDKICRTVSGQETVQAEFTPLDSSLKYKFEELEILLK